MEARAGAEKVERRRAGGGDREREESQEGTALTAVGTLVPRVNVSG